MGDSWKTALAMLVEEYRNQWEPDIMAGKPIEGIRQLEYVSFRDRLKSAMEFYHEKVIESAAANMDLGGVLGGLERISRDSMVMAIRKMSEATSFDAYKDGLVDMARLASLIVGAA